MATTAAPAAPQGAVTDAYHRILESIAPNAAVMKKKYNGNLGRGLLTASAIFLGAIGGFQLYNKLTEVPDIVEGPPPIQVAYGEIEPPSIEDEIIEEQTTAPAAAAPAAPSATPNPVPDKEVPKEAPKLATQTQLANAGTGDPNAPAGGVRTGVRGGTGTATAPVRREAVTLKPAAEAPPSGPPPRVEKPEPEPAVQEPITFAEKMPEIVGGLERFQSNIEYPDFDRRAGTQGRVVVQFTVEPDGRTSNVEVVRPVSPGLDRAARDAVARARFSPGEQNGQKVRVKMTLPVEFKVN